MFNIAYFLSNYKLLYFASYYTFWESNSQIVYISVSRSLQLRSVVYTRMFIKSATFEFSAQKIFLSGKYQKNTLCKILADLKKLSWRRISIFWKHYIQYILKHSTFEFPAQTFDLYCVAVAAHSHSHLKYLIVRFANT